MQIYSESLEHIKYALNGRSLDKVKLVLDCWYQIKYALDGRSLGQINMQIDDREKVCDFLPCSYLKLFTSSHFQQSDSLTLKFGISCLMGMVML